MTREVITILVVVFLVVVVGFLMSLFQGVSVW